MRAVTRNRLLSTAVAAATTSGLVAGTASPERGLAAAYGVVATVGYGHLLASARPFERLRRWSPQGARPWLPAAFLLTSIATAFVLYRALLEAEPRAVALVLALSAWHSWENDQALATAYASRGLPGPTRISPSAAFAATAGALAAAPFLLGVKGSDLEIAVFVAPTTYHLASWLVLTMDRMRWLRRGGRADAARRLRRRLVGCHAAALLPLAVALLAPRSDAAPLAGALLSLPVYLFATALHILDTATRRGFERAPAADGA